MDARKKLFIQSRLYDHKGSDRLFVRAVRQNIAFHAKHCPEYARILAKHGITPGKIKCIGDLSNVPPIPTLYLKAHKLLSLSEKKLFIKATSSGTKGKKSRIGFDLKGLYYGAYMVLRTAGFHKLLSLQPVNYLVLGYQPDPSNHTVISKTAYGATFFAPALHRTYALKPSSTGYRLDMEGLKKALISYSRQPFPVRLIGFPAYTYFLLTQLKRSGIRLKLHKSSKVLLGGGWKQFYTEKVDKATLYALIYEVLGIREENCREFFGAVEHPIIYCDCKKHHFHVPAYSRVIIRDVHTLKPVGYGRPGLVNLLTPMLDSMPLVSVMTDDLGILHEGNECGCGIDTPWFEIIGRVGVQDIKTCAAGAGELLNR
jgi:phenylacetate-coenzyme A ligase PaaK-like adenylate-forming protein